MAFHRYFENNFFDTVTPSRFSEETFESRHCNNHDLIRASFSRRPRRALVVPYHKSFRPPKDKDAFQVSLDVQHFAPEELTVKTSGDNMIIVQGKHEDREDEHGYVQREFVRKYTVPKGYNIELVHSRLSSDAVLTITVPKEKSIDTREIPIMITGTPSKPIENGPTAGGDQQQVVEKEKKKSTGGRKTK